MTACSDFKSLLPSPSAHELALERVSREKYCAADPDVIRTLLNPETCPAELLPLLAYSLSVNVFNPRWPEQTQRAVCANSLNVHVHNGTLEGIDQALDALGVRAEITEWWQQVPEGKPGTMDLMLWVNDNINPDSAVMVDSEMIRDLVTTINNTKRLSIHYQFSIGAELSTGLTTGLSAGEVSQLVRADACHTKTQVNARPSDCRIGSSVEVSQLHRIEAAATRTEVKPRLFYQTMASSVECRQLTHIEAHV